MSVSGLFAVVVTMILFLSTPTECFNSNNYDRCENQEFCKHHMDLASTDRGASHVVRRGSWYSSGNSIGLDVDEVGQVSPYHVDIQSLGNGISFVRISDSDKKRYSVQDVRVNRPQSNRRAVVSGIGSGKERDVVMDVGNGYTVTVKQPHFRVILGDSEGKRASIELNARGLLYYRPENDSSFGMDIRFGDVKHVAGIPEHAESVVLPHTEGKEPYRLYNADVFEYAPHETVGLYGSVPYMVGYGENGAVGMLLMNAAQMFVGVNDAALLNGKTVVDTHWVCESGMLELYLFSGGSFRELSEQYAFITGTMRMPQYFSLGYHQCRWNYKDTQDCLTVNRMFEEQNIPYDVLWLDIEHTDGKRYFTWDKSVFEDPIGLQTSIAAYGRKMVTITDPHIKRDDGYFVHKKANTAGYYVKDEHGSDYSGNCWPGSSSWLDYYNPEVRDWYASLFQFENYEGSTENLYSWIDMNEPSVFDKPDTTMDKNAVHWGGVEHRDIHNLYGFYHGIATCQGHLERRDGNDRPFILSRSFFAGSQRYVAVWTGDNSADWSHLQITTSMILSLSLSGIQFVGADVGGFFGNPDQELFARWYEAAAFHPFFRGHAHLETNRREPWVFEEPTTSYVRNAIITRYAYLPYLYTQFFLSYVGGIAPVRPIFFEYYEDVGTHNIDDAFLVGRDLMIKPVVHPGVTSQDVYIPGNDIWYYLPSGEKFGSGDHSATVSCPLGTIPLFQRGGSIVAKKERLRRSTAQMTNDPFTIVIAVDRNSEAEGVLYVDDGHSLAHEKGEFAFRDLSFKDSTLRCTKGDIGPHAGFWYNDDFGQPTYSAEALVERIVLIGLDSAPTSVFISVDDASAPGSPIAQRVILSHEFNASRRELIVKKPMVSVLNDWEMQFLY